MTAAIRDPRGQLKIACSGYVEPSSGSIAAVGYTVLDQLLRRGHRIDFFSKPSFVYPTDLLSKHEGLQYIVSADPAAERMKSVAESTLGREIAKPVSMLQHKAFAHAVLRQMRLRHCEVSYDVVLFLGTPNFGRLKSVPGVAWVQGVGGTDVRSIYDRADLLRRTEARWRLELLKAFGRFRTTLGRRDYSACDAVVCGSDWSRNALIDRDNLRPDQVLSLPYPLEFDGFEARKELPSRSGPLRVLWLGRIVPRKRLDLLLDASAECERRGVPIELTVIGRVGFAPGLQTLLQQYPHGGRLRHIAHVPRDQVGTYLRQADILCQPSDEEDFGMSVAEALACGTPVIVGATNGTGDYVCPMSRRLPTNSIEALAEALLDAAQRKSAGTLVDPSLTRQHAETTFDPEAIVTRLEELLHDVAAVPVEKVTS